MNSSKKRELYLITFFIIGKIILRLEQFSFVYFSITIFAFIALLVVYLKIIKSLLKAFSIPFVLSLLLVLGYLIIRTKMMGFPIPIYLWMVLLMPIGIFLAYKNEIIKEPGICFSIISNIYLIFFIANVILMLIMPNLFNGSADKQGFLIASNYNQMGGIIVPGLLSATGAMQYNNKYKKKFLFMIILSIFMVLYAGSMTSSICLTLILIYFVFAHRCRFVSKLAFGGMTFCISFFFIDVVITSLSDVIAFDGIIDRFLTFIGKDATFSGRTTVWFRSFFYFTSNPITGIGFYDKEWSEMYLSVANTHNIFMEILLQGGIVWTVIILFIIFRLIREVIKINTKESRLALFILLVYLFMMQLEVYRYFHIIMAFLILYMMSYANKNLKL